MKTAMILVPCDEEQKSWIRSAVPADWQVVYSTRKGLQAEMDRREGNALDEEGGSEELKGLDLDSVEVIVGEPDIPYIKKLSGLRWIQMTWAGTDKYTMKPGFPQEVLLTNASGAFGVIISEYVLGGILTLYRNFPRYRELQKDHWWKDGGSEKSLWGKHVLILGTGNIGSETAKRLKAFDAVTVGLNSTGHSAPYFDETRPLSAIDEEIGKADVLVGCIPNHPDTVGLLTKDRFLAMKKDAVFVNVGRGLLVAPGALEEVLASGHLFGAVLDVHGIEPLPKDSPLWDMENVLITPHIAGPSFLHCRDTENRIWDIFTENMAHYLAGEKLIHQIKVPE